MRKTLIVLFSLVIGLSLNAQPWMNNLKQKSDKELNFYDLQEAFYNYFDQFESKKGSGWKQFKRIEWFASPRVYPTGEFPEYALYNAYKQEQLQRKEKSTYTANWTPLGPNDTPLDINNQSRSGSGRINCITFHPTDPDIIYIGAPSGGIWKSLDGGAHWTSNTDFLTGLGVSDLGINPQNPDILYWVTGDKDGGNTSPTYSFGIMKSIDAGETWEPTGLVHQISQTIRMRRILVNPINPDTLIVCGSSGLYTSIDAGDTWNQAKTGNFHDMEFKPGNPDVVYASAGGSVYKSIDSGFTWTQLTNGIPSSGINRIELTVTEANPEVLYVLMSKSSNSAFKALYKSSDSGENWSLQSSEDNINLFGWAPAGDDSDGIGWYAIAVAASHENENVLFAGSVNIWKSVDGGVNWTLAAHWYGGGGAPYVHADEHRLDFNPLNNTLYSGNDGGFYKTENLSEWTDLSDGLGILQVYRMGTSASDPGIIVEGSQDNGTFKYNNGVWNSVRGGDGMEAIVDYSNPNIMYSSTQNGGLARSTNGGKNWTGMKPNGASGSWVTPYVMSKQDHQTIIAGFEDVYKSINMGSYWRKISNNLTGGNSLNAIEVAPSNDEQIYTSNGSRIWVTKNDGAKWTEISDGLPNLSIEYITVSQTDPDRVWVSFSGFSDGEKVFYSDNAGASWINYSEGLPNLPVNCITYKFNSEDALYAGTDLGVYYRNKNMDSWENFDDQLPNVIVNELEINYRINKIRAATFGRGIWESDLVPDAYLPPVVNIVASVNNNQITLNWNTGDGGNADSYKIFRNDELVETAANKEYTDETSIPGINYRYMIIAVYDGKESVASDELSIIIREPAVIPYNEDFEAENHGWLIKNTPDGWNWGTTSELQLGTGNDSYILGVNSGAAGELFVTDYAILPKLNIAGQSGLEIKFDYILRRWLDVDHLFLQFRKSEADDWQTIEELPVSGINYNTWTNYAIMIPDSLYVDDLELAFFYTDRNDLGYGAGLDNIYIGPETSSILDLENGNELKIYPNPSEGEFWIDIDNPKGSAIDITVYSVEGKEVYNKQFGHSLSSIKEEIKLSNKTGYYLVNVRIADKNYQRKVFLK